MRIESIFGRYLHENSNNANKSVALCRTAPTKDPVSQQNTYYRKRTDFITKKFCLLTLRAVGSIHNKFATVATTPSVKTRQNGGRARVFCTQVINHKNWRTNSNSTPTDVRSSRSMRSTFCRLINYLIIKRYCSASN